MTAIKGATQALHRSEGGVREGQLGLGPLSFAREVSRYISCPTTVRARTLEQFGRAPTLDEITAMRRGHVEAREGFRQIVDGFGTSDEDAYSYQAGPTSRLRTLPAAKPKSAGTIEIIETGCRAIPTLVPDIIAAIATAFCVSAKDIVGPDRRRPIARARQACAYVLWRRGNSYPQVGRWLGGRDHSTMIHACRRFEIFATPAMRAVAERYIGGLR